MDRLHLSGTADDAEPISLSYPLHSGVRTAAPNLLSTTHMSRADFVILEGSPQPGSSSVHGVGDPPLSDLQIIPAEAPGGVRDAVQALLFGVRAGLGFDEARLGQWRERIARDLRGFDWTVPSAEAAALRQIDGLGAEFVCTVVAPKQYRSLLLLWVATLAAMVAVAALLGLNGLLMQCSSDGVFGRTVCAPIAGHLVSYLYFQYAVYGVLLGTGLRLSYSRSSAGLEAPQARIRLLDRPLLNFILGLTVAYVICNLVACGRLELSLFGFDIKNTITTGPDGLPAPVFRDAAALLVVGLASSIASDLYVQRLVEGGRRAAQEFLSTKSTDPAAL